MTTNKEKMRMVGKKDGYPILLEAPRLYYESKDGSLVLFTADDPFLKAIYDVAAERTRQVFSEGWTPAHDDEHTNGELARAAVCYAEPRLFRSVRILELGEPHQELWPWQDEWFKPSTVLRNLVKAAALLIAEIERLYRTERPAPK